MWHGILDVTWKSAVWWALGLTHITIIGVTVFLHRAQAHRALELHPAVSHFFRFWMWITTGMITKKWVDVVGFLNLQPTLFRDAFLKGVITENSNWETILHYLTAVFECGVKSVFPQKAVPTHDKILEH